MNQLHNKILLNNMKSKLLFNEPMKKHTTFGIGGPASIFIYPYDKKELILLLKIINDEKLSFFITGSGTNLLVDDNGFNGIVISLSKTFKKLFIKGPTVIAESGVMLGHFVKEAINNSIGGLEGLVGVPGTLGGALFMNAGAFGEEISNYFQSATVITLEGKEKTYTKKDINFKYRESSFKPDEIISEATFICQYNNPIKIKNKKYVSSQKRKLSQPLKFRSAGSIFKNPKNAPPAGYLIDNAGLKGEKSGDAEISTKHANFIINHGNAKSKDVINLIKIIQEKVKNKFNVNLELEIKLLGFSNELKTQINYAN